MAAEMDAQERTENARLHADASWPDDPWEPAGLGAYVWVVVGAICVVGSVLLVGAIVIGMIVDIFNGCEECR